MAESIRYTGTFMAAVFAVVMICIFPSLMIGSEAKFSFSSATSDILFLQKRLADKNSIKAVTKATSPPPPKAPYNPCIPIKGRGGHGPDKGKRPPGVGGHPCAGKNSPGQSGGTGGGKGFRRLPPPPPSPPPFSRPPRIGRHTPNSFGVLPGRHPPGVGNHARQRCNKWKDFCIRNEYHVSRNETTCCRKRCVNLEYDSVNCGNCFASCEAPNQCCQAQCVDVSTDLSNCGLCGSSCKVGGACNVGTCFY